MMTEQEALYEMACDCALSRVKHKCKNRFGSTECTNCNLYIVNHSQASMNELRLFMYTAEVEAARIQNQLKYHSAVAYAMRDIRDFILGLIKFLVISGIIVGLFYGACQIVKHEKQTSVVVPKYHKINAAQTDLSRLKSPDDNIRTTLEIVKNRWIQHGGVPKQTLDLNRDGVSYQCEDAAILFYINYPDKENCGIWANTRLGKGGDLVFNAVKLNGVWVGIDPLASVFWEDKAYFMYSIYGNLYDPQYNYDAWYKYGRFCE